MKKILRASKESVDLLLKCIKEWEGLIVEAMKNHKCHYLSFYDADGNFLEIDHPHCFYWNEDDYVVHQLVSAVYIRNNRLYIIPDPFDPISKTYKNKYTHLTEEQVQLYYEELQPYSYRWEDICNPTDTIRDLLSSVAQTLQITNPKIK